MWTTLAVIALAYVVYDVIVETQAGRVWSTTRN